MSKVWESMKRARIQVGIEAVLLKSFGARGQSLERRVIQSSEFREKVLPVLAEFSLKKRVLFTSDNIWNLRGAKV